MRMKSGGAEVQKMSGARQQGITLVGLIFVLAILGMVGVIGLKVVPTYLEYQAIKKAIVTAKEDGQSVQAIQTAFDKRANVGYIESITGKDLVVVRNANNEFDVSFAYDKKIPLVGPASLLMEYEGTTAATGPAKKTIE